jgi:hypothetical protein
MYPAAVMEKPAKQAADKIESVRKNETQYKVLSEKDALIMTDEVIKKYRPALEELAK